MKRIGTGDPNCLAFNEPAGWGWLILVPIYTAAAGFALFLCFGPFGLVDELTNSSPLAALVVWAVIAVTVYKVVAGAGRFFGRRRFQVDLLTNTATAQWGFLGLPLWISSVRLDEYDALFVDGTETRSSAGSSFDYYLRLTGPGRRPVCIGHADTKAVLLDVAREVAEFAPLEVWDATYVPPHPLSLAAFEDEIGALLAAPVHEEK